MPLDSLKDVVSVDVEDYFHAEAMAHAVQRSQWDQCACRVEGNTQRLLELFAAHQVQATFFVVGWVADRYPALVRQIAAAGHELACHSYWHRPIYKLNPKDFREDTRQAKDVIEQIAGVAIFGYRAPTYSIVASSLWALEILVEIGFTYDSSIFPIRHDRYGIPSAPRGPFRIKTPAGPLLEFPLTTFRIGNRSMPVAGGGYLRLLPLWYTRLGIRRARRERLPIIAYVHPWEIDPDQPRLPVTLTSRLRHYTNLSKTYERLNDMLLEGTFTSFRESGLAKMVEDVDICACQQHKN